MSLTRRSTLKLGLAAGAITVMPFAGRAQMAKGDTYEADGGEIVVHPISHASLVLNAPDFVIYADPVGGAALYDGHSAPDLILVTHQHGDHFDAETLTALAGDQTKLVVNPAVYDMLPEELKAKATAVANGETASVGAVEIEAIAAYNTTEGRLQYHPKGRDNGYVVSVAGRRIYVAGDTEDIPEMRSLSDIDIAFVPMNLPYTMDVDQAASAVAAFKPAVVYPYHYRGSDPEAFAAKVAEAADGVEVVIGRWYS